MKTTFAANLALTVALGTALLYVTAVPVFAQTSPDVKPAAKSVAKPVAKPATNAVAKKKPAVSASRTEIKSTAKNVAAGIEAAEAALTPEEIAIAERVYIGRLPCELGAFVTLTAEKKTPGYFDVEGKNFKYRMFPVPTTTGTVRLEDRKGGAVWLQMGNKSMLMSQKLGTRIADECVSPAQVAVAEALKLNPPVSVLDAPKPAVSVTSVVSAPALPASAAK